ncbi:gamma-glutamylcyclotransferase [Alcaligenes endophyticus]|uniref:glutathione-specific gamma-glutamylcyclotransferase n=1 Tax=Alcaligenes endophyticus TaxID=1929088 RepID=A0ABT8EGX6_9BURK|nr:gamma-glutamylcyclotransferase [Alcaligenes endophyticus]MCX5589942.1 gamma-glutamylcyclotransferase [Alcaligenes endophyticus]MDN4120395.1 gamma-glutamylcyclotransferase [Alcaligenes endophyticus]
MLTRELLLSGAYLASFQDLPGQPRWTEQQIRQSMLDTLAQHSAGPVWVFAYGSLIWNPIFHYSTQTAARLQGWHRSFCIKLNAGRGTPEKPGRMLALQAGGSTQGVAFKLNEDNLLDELWLIWAREMVYGSYLPIWCPLELANGEHVPGIVFVANPEHVQFIADASIDTTVPIILQAQGILGSNLDYLLQLQQSLQSFDINDAYIDALSQAALTEHIG